MESDLDSESDFESDSDLDSDSDSDLDPDPMKQNWGRVGSNQCVFLDAVGPASKLFSFRALILHSRGGTSAAASKAI